MTARSLPPSGEIPRLYRPTWAEVNIRALLSNLKKLRKKAPRSDVMLVVKADGYGHGAVGVSRAAETSGLVQWFGVSSVEEGIVLRDAGIRRPILILGSLYPFESTVAAIRYGLTPTVASLEGARLIEQAAEAVESMHTGERAPAPLACHLKIDTGMGRVGVRWPSGKAVVNYLARSEGVRLEGVFTHLSCAEENTAFSRGQLKVFKAAVRDIEKMGVTLRLKHAANSAAAIRFPESRWNLIRPGLAAYGLYPGFEPVMSLKTRVVFLKNVGKGAPISYGALYRTRRPSRIATLPIGYGDGLPRLLSSVGKSKKRPSILIRSKRCPIVGALTMDMMMVDVTGVNGVSVGDEAVIIGRQGRHCIDVRELASSAQTIPYEIVTGIKARVPRICVR